MASLGSATVTIDRGYFETLVRRARFNSAQDEYERLTSIAKKYENLRRNLLRGGVDEEIMDLLSKDDDAIQAGNTTQASLAHAVPPTEDGGARLDTATPMQSTSFFDQPRLSTNGYNGRNGNGGGSYNHHVESQYHEQTWADAEPDEFEAASVEGDTPVEGPAHDNQAKPATQRPQFDRQCTRTVQLTNLSEGTTHGDITSAVRGGMLLDVFVRTHERSASASLSFLHAQDARAFYNRVRKHDLYIKNKRVDIKWADRQFILPGHVAGKIAMGATRNLVIRRCDNRHTEEGIREDLDHIHNLVVVKIEFLGGNCYINLNSVHNAIYARSCMLSRFKYKGNKIDWEVDECAQPYEPPPPPVKRKEAPAPRRPPAASRNRFQLLNVDGEDEDEISAAFQSKKPAGLVGITA